MPKGENRIRENTILSTIDGVLSIDVSTPSFPDSVMLILATDWDIVRSQGWSASAVSPPSSKTRYAQVHSRILKRNVRVHRIVMGCCTGDEVDHINQNGLDNRRCNLRIVTRSQNATNIFKRCDNTSGVSGVYLHKKKQLWIARIWCGGVYTYLGSFKTLEEARQCRLDAEEKHHGKYSPRKRKEELA